MDSLPLVRLKLVTIVCETLLEERLLRDLKAVGVRGYTRSEAQGEGRRQVHDVWEGNNARIEMLVSEEVAGRVIDRLREAYLPRYPVIAWINDVQAVFSARQIDAP